VVVQPAETKPTRASINKKRKNTFFLFIIFS
jgi:hypothetical protein